MSKFHYYVIHAFILAVVAFAGKAFAEADPELALFFDSYGDQEAAQDELVPEVDPVAPMAVLTSSFPAWVGDDEVLPIPGETAPAARAVLPLVVRGCALTLTAETWALSVYERGARQRPEILSDAIAPRSTVQPGAEREILLTASTEPRVVPAATPACEALKRAGRIAVDALSLDDLRLTATAAGKIHVLKPISKRRPTEVFLRWIGKSHEFLLEDRIGSRAMLESGIQRLKVAPSEALALGIRPKLNQRPVKEDR